MSKRILVVEDQEDLRAILRDFLSAFGYTVIDDVNDGPSMGLKASNFWSACPEFSGMEASPLNTDR